MSISERTIRTGARSLRQLAGVAALALLASCGGGESGSGVQIPAPTPTPSPTPTPTPSPTPTPTPTPACAAYPAEARGPHPADGTNATSGATNNILTASGVARSDIRPSLLAGGTTAVGVPVMLTLTLVNSDQNCTALPGYVVYLWQPDAQGRYSLYDAPLESYLRGTQTSDAQGRVTFTTIVPGVDTGRYPHLHIQIFRTAGGATSGSNATLVSQIAIPRTVAQAVYADAATYPGSANRLTATPIETDPVFGDNGDAGRDAMTLRMDGSAAAGYSATLTIGVPVPPGI